MKEKRSRAMCLNGVTVLCVLLISVVLVISLGVISAQAEEGDSVEVQEDTIGDLELEEWTDGTTDEFLFGENITFEADFNNTGGSDGDTFTVDFWLEDVNIGTVEDQELNESDSVNETFTLDPVEQSDYEDAIDSLGTYEVSAEYDGENYSTTTDIEVTGVDPFEFSDFEYPPDEVLDDGEFEVSVNASNTDEDDTDTDLNTILEIDGEEVANFTDGLGAENDTVLSHTVDAEDYDLGEYNLTFYEDDIEVYSDDFEVVDTLEVAAIEYSDYEVIVETDDADLNEAMNVSEEEDEPFWDVFGLYGNSTMTTVNIDEDDLNGTIDVTIRSLEDNETLGFDEIGRWMSDSMVTADVDEGFELVLDEWEGDAMSIGEGDGTTFEIDIDNSTDGDEVVIYTNPRFQHYLTAWYMSVLGGDFGISGMIMPALFVKPFKQSLGS